MFCFVWPEKNIQGLLWRHASTALATAGGKPRFIARIWLALLIIGNILPFGLPVRDGAEEVSA